MLDDVTVSIRTTEAVAAFQLVKPRLADPGTRFRVAGSEGELAEYDEEGLSEFLIDWIQTRPNAA